MFPLMQNSRKQKLICSDRKQTSDSLGLGQRKGWAAKGQEIFRGNENIGCGVGFTMSTSIKTSYILPLNGYFMVYKYFN